MSLYTSQGCTTCWCSSSPLEGQADRSVHTQSIFRCPKWQVRKLISPDDFPGPNWCSAKTSLLSPCTHWDTGTGPEAAHRDSIDIKYHTGAVSSTKWPFSNILLRVSHDVNPSTTGETSLELWLSSRYLVSPRHSIPPTTTFDGGLGSHKPHLVALVQK